MFEINNMSSTQTQKFKKQKMLLSLFNETGIILLQKQDKDIIRKNKQTTDPYFP